MKITRVGLIPSFKITIGRGVKKITILSDGAPNLSVIRFRGSEQEWESIEHRVINGFSDLTIEFNAP